MKRNYMQTWALYSGPTNQSLTHCNAMLGPANKRKKKGTTRG